MEVLKIRKVGNSEGVILPKKMLDDVRVSAGDTLHAVRTSEGILLTPYDPAFDEQMDAFDRSVKKFRNAYRQLAK